jgi:hypothetical protein
VLRVPKVTGLVIKRTHTTLVVRLQTKDPEKVALGSHKGKEHSLIVQGFCGKEDCCTKSCGITPCAEYKHFLAVANITHSAQVKNKSVVTLNKKTDLSGQPRAQYAVKLEKAVPLKETELKKQKKPSKRLKKMVEENPEINNKILPKKSPKDNYKD